MREGVVPFHPFAFQVHSHHIGRVIMGYKVDLKSSFLVTFLSMLLER